MASTLNVSSVNAQSNETTSPNLYSNSANQVVGPTILPEATGSVNGGNPFQGLGRPDDTGPVRTTPMQQYVPGSNTTGMFSTESSFPSLQSVEQPGFGGQAGFSSNNTSSTPGTTNPALNQSSIPALNQAPGETNPGPNGALIQNLNPLPQTLPNANNALQDRRPEAGSDTASNTRIKPVSSSESGKEIDKMLSRAQELRDSQAKPTHNSNSRESNQLATAIKEMNSGKYKKCLETLDSILKSEPKNAQVYYVKAVTNVMMRDFTRARQNYEMTLKCTTDEQLIAKTKAGLNKLGH